MNHSLPSRRSIRLQAYDYATEGLYFVTICVQGRRCLFGEVVDGTIVLNDAGKMIGEWYIEIGNKFFDIRCHEMITMPNHIHFIIQNVGADPCVCPSDDNAQSHISGEHVGSPLHRVVQWFKTMTTNHYIRGVKNDNWLSFDGKLWQRNYHEHIIRNQHAYEHIANYIITNPISWEEDIYKNIE